MAARGRRQAMRRRRTRRYLRCLREGVLSLSDASDLNGERVVVSDFSRVWSRFNNGFNRGAN
jgi:hypothetical protein